MVVAEKHGADVAAEEEEEVQAKLTKNMRKNRRKKLLRLPLHRSWLAYFSMHSRATASTYSQHKQS